MGASIEITCSTCGRDAFLVRKPRYEGFKRMGDDLLCSACGHVYPAETDVPFKEAPGKPVLFDESDRPRPADVFAGDERGRLCRYCVNYVVNPFRQWCGHHHREVQATDTCSAFTPRPAPPI